MKTKAAAKFSGGSYAAGAKTEKQTVIDPFDLINDQFSNLQAKLMSTLNPIEKSILCKRLRNLQNVKQFLVSTRTDDPKAA
jgi:hypothetical protein